MCKIKFKIGDKVRIIADNNGDVYVIHTVYDSLQTIIVTKLNMGCNYKKPYTYDEIELIKE